MDERPCLYNTKPRDYFKRDKKKVALDEIALRSTMTADATSRTFSSGTIRHEYARAQLSDVYYSIM